WYHMCFTHNHVTHHIRTFIDGVLVQHAYYDVGRPVIGDYAAVGNGQTADESYSGDLSQINVWDTILSDDEIRQMARCRSDPKGNYISWEAGWTLYNVSTYDMSLSDFCSREVDILYFWFPRALELTAQYICEALGTHLPTVTNLQEVRHLYNILDETWPESEKCPRYYWSDLNDKQEENVWVSSYDGRVDNVSYWSPDEPNGFRYENCAAVRQDGLIDDDCAWPMCALCTFTKPQRFSFLGTCEKELRNVYFVAYQEDFGELTFKSYGVYHIRKENGTWLYIDNVENVTIATMEPFEPDYPMGRRVWTLESEVCGQKEGPRRFLLTPCETFQFTCDDGTCIPLKYRCDLKYDCRDQSDELECELIAFPEDYHKHLPPRKPGKEEGFLPVVIKVIIKSIDIQTVMMSMQLSYEIEMSWYDNRLEFRNLKVNDSLNSPLVARMMELWSPLVKLLNTDTIDKILLAEDATTVVKRLEEAVRRDEGALLGVDIYSGGGNPISVSRKYSTVYTCNFDLTLYPFDDQHCDIHMQIVSGQVSFLEASPNSSVVYLGSRVLSEYEIGDVKVLLGAPKIPSEIRASSSLPTTSYFKMVDIWLLFCVGITFLVIIFHILIDNRLYQDEMVKSLTVRPKSIGGFLEDKPQPILLRLKCRMSMSVEQLELTAKLTLFVFCAVFMVVYAILIF
ncbi:putative basement membrane-specific heparan sulfate proteoglycan core protein, partial [Penaeus vannamei]